MHPLRELLTLGSCSALLLKRTAGAKVHGEAPGGLAVVLANMWYILLWLSRTKLMKKSTSWPMTNSSPHLANTIAQRIASKASIMVNAFCGSGTFLSLRTSEPEASRLRSSKNLSSDLIGPRVNLATRGKVAGRNDLAELHRAKEARGLVLVDHPRERFLRSD